MGAGAAAAAAAAAAAGASSAALAAGCAQGRAAGLCVWCRAFPLLQLRHGKRLRHGWRRRQRRRCLRQAPRRRPQRLASRPCPAFACLQRLLRAAAAGPAAAGAAGAASAPAPAPAAAPAPGAGPRPPLAAAAPPLQQQRQQQQRQRQHRGPAGPPPLTRDAAPQRAAISLHSSTWHSRGCPSQKGTYREPSRHKGQGNRAWHSEGAPQSNRPPSTAAAHPLLFTASSLLQKTQHTHTRAAAHK